MSSTPPGDSSEQQPAQPGQPGPDQTQPLGYWEQQAQQQAPQPPQPPPGYGQPSQPAYPPQPSGYGQPAYRPLDHPRASTALVLGLVAMVGGLACYLPLAIGPWAWAIGRRTVRDIDAEPQRYGGRGMAMAGYVLGVIATVLFVLGILALVGLFAIGLSMGPGPITGNGLRA